eukprot:2972010-Pyramimonas_sp.AAC.1
MSWNQRSAILQVTQAGTTEQERGQPEWLVQKLQLSTYGSGHRGRPHQDRTVQATDGASYHRQVARISTQGEANHHAVNVVDGGEMLRAGPPRPRGLIASPPGLRRR